MTDREHADWLRSLPREVPPEQVIEVEHAADVERGPYIPHHHHPYFGEAAH